VGDRCNGFAPVDMKALWENLLMKEYIKRYVAWLWKTGQYRLIYSFKNSSDKDVEDFLAYARKHDNNYQVPLIAKGELETNLLRDMKETESLVELLKYLDGQTLILLEMPPVDAGIPDASGRSSADAQSNSLTTTVHAFKKLFEDAYNYQLFPKINKGNTLIRYAPIDRFAEKQVFEIIQIMQTVNMKDEVIKEFMQDRGMFFKSPELFKDMTQIPGVMKNPKSLEMPKGKKGTGEGNKPRSEVTTRPDQLKKQ
jgi:hypothetical protein